MVRRTTIGLALAVLSATCVAAGDSRPERGVPVARARLPRACPFDALSYRIELELSPETRAVAARCQVSLAALERASPLREVRLDLAGLTVAAVRDGGGRALRFRHVGEELRIDLAVPLAAGEETVLDISYGGVPERGLWFSGERGDRPPTMVFSHGQSRENHGWFPCFDEPGERATSELLLDMPASWTSLASGARVATADENGRRREHWRMDFPHPPYLLGLVAGELVIQEGRAGAVPLFFAAEPHLADRLAATFAETDEILAFFEDFTGQAYPYAKYSQAAADNFPWGGMENISATTLTPRLLSDERGHRDEPPFPLIAHEAAHQWFGDWMTCADWSHLWLNEGFATYGALLYLEHSRGVDEFRAELREVQAAYLGEDVGSARRPIVWNVWKEPDDVFDTRPYQGAAARLHLLRTVLGDADFRAGIRAYVAESRGRSVVTADLVRSLERTTGRELDAFFEQWFLRPGFPEFALAWEWNDARRIVLLTVEQIQDPTGGTPEVFSIPVDVEVRDGAGVRSVRVELDERRERFELPAPERPEYVLFDVHGAIPKLAHEDKRAAEWSAIARRAEDVNARREAATALGRLAASSSSQAGAALAEVLDRLDSDASSWVRAAAAAALEGNTSVEAEDALRAAALGDEAPRVRAAALTALCALGPDEGRGSLAEEAFYGGPSYRVMAAGARLLAHAAPERAFEFYAAALEVESPHDVLAVLLLGDFSDLADPRVPAELRALALDRDYSPVARATAVGGLARVARERPEGARVVASLLDDPSFHVRQAAVTTLVQIGDAPARRALEAYYPRARTAPERRAIEALSPWGGR